MTGKNQSDRENTFSYRILSAIFFAIIILISLFSAISFIDDSLYLRETFQEEMKETEQNLVHSANLINQGLILYDTSFDRELMTHFETFLDAYTRSGGDPSLMNLSVLKSQIERGASGDIDLYIINETGIIEYTTYEPDYLLDFSVWPEVYEEITQIRLNNAYSSDRVVKGFTDSAIKKYAYFPTPDHRYLFEISLSSTDFDTTRDRKFSYLAIAQDIPELRKIVESIKFFDETVTFSDDPKTGLVGSEYYPDYLLTPEKQALITEVFKTKEDRQEQDRANHIITTYLYIDLNDDKTVSSSKLSLVAEIDYTTAVLDETIFSKLILSLAFICFSIIIALIIAYSVYRFISKPVDEIIEDIEIIADGDYDHPIRPTQGIDLERLGKSIMIMVDRLRENINQIKGQSDQIEEQSEELRQELVQRNEIEKALLLANKKLNLLSGITRHDIRNQINALMLFHETLRKKLSHDPGGEELIDTLNQISETILNQIEFTKDYQELGSGEAAWHHIGEILENIIAENRFFGIDIGYQTKSLEIFADKMIEKVFYNLLDNAIRHGGTITTITISYQIRDTFCIIVVEDDGKGVPDQIKEKIFTQGFGSNTGFGLFLSREVLAITGITITETGQEYQGARFEILVPPGKWRLKNEEIFSSAEQP
ncbi:MAG: HAMP domain-containing histidine kinase [Methanospirillaceae archaeon]|nr:HAMP domain-containing histidine kinase [Methanospirillaceae archaeon]